MRARGTAIGRVLCAVLLLSHLQHCCAVCAGEYVMVQFDASNIAHNNFAGQHPAAGMPENIRIQNAAVHNGMSIDLLLDSPMSSGASGPCLGTGTCDFGVNRHGVSHFKVQRGDANHFDVRWSFEYTDGSGAATLPQVAITWLDMGPRECVRHCLQDGPLARRSPHAGTTYPDFPPMQVRSDRGGLL